MVMFVITNVLNMIYRRAITRFQGAAMTSDPGSAPVLLRVNLEIVRGHYNDAARMHFRSRARAAQFAAIRDIPILISEIERLSDLLAEVLVRHTNLRGAALATMTAYEADEADPLLQIRLVLSADSRRRWIG